MARESHDPQSPDGAAAVNIEVLLPGFAPIAELWQSAPLAFNTEPAARWFILQWRERLVAANALGFIGRRSFYHRERLKRVVEEIALEQARTRFSRSKAAAARAEA